jgi:hypothetical protein
MSDDITRMRYADNMDHIFDELAGLTTIQRHMIKERYRFLMSDYRHRCRLYSALFYIFRLTMTVGSLAVPALLTIQNTPGASVAMYWVTWVISLAVTTSNGIMLLFKIDKRFFMMHATIERLRSETWQFVELAGRYSGHYTHPIPPTHANQFVYYCTQLEKINMKRVDEEYIKTGEENVNSPPQPGGIPQASRDAMVPSPPDPLNSSMRGRRFSAIVIEDQQDEKDTKTTEKPVSLPQLQNGSTVPEQTLAGNTILQTLPELQGQPDVGVRAAV